MVVSVHVPDDRYSSDNSFGRQTGLVTLESSRILAAYFKRNTDATDATDFRGTEGTRMTRIERIFADVTIVTDRHVLMILAGYHKNGEM
jgi:hypothetical protein